MLGAIFVMPGAFLVLDLSSPRKEVPRDALHSAKQGGGMFFVGENLIQNGGIPLRITLDNIEGVGGVGRFFCFDDGLNASLAVCGQQALFLWILSLDCWNG